MSPQDKKRILRRLERSNRIEKSDLDQLREDINNELDKRLDKKKESFSKLSLDMHFAHIGITTN